MQAFFTIFALSTLFLSIDSTSVHEPVIAGFSITNVTEPELAAAGNTAFTPCAGVRSSVVLQSLSLNPNPLSLKSPVRVTSRGKVSVPVTKGAKMKIITKVGPLTVDTQTFDMCAEAKKTGKKCPIRPGVHNFNLVVKPKATAVPYITFDVRAEATNGNGKPLFCFTNKLKFVP